MAASGSCTVTPGATFSASTPVTPTTLSAAAKPVVQVDEQAIGKRHLVKAELVELLGTGAAGYNYLDNGNFAENRWSRGSTPTSCATTAKTYRADRWWCTPAGAPVTYERVQSGPNTLSLHTARVTGATGATTVDFGQDIPRRIASALAAKLLLSFWIHNDTGASITPTIRVNTPAAADNFGSVTNRISITPTTMAANGTWQKYEVQLDCTGLANITNGLQLVLRLPSGALSGASKSVTIAQCKLEVSDQTSASPFVPEREEAESDPANSSAPRNLLINGQLDRFAQGGVNAVALTSDFETWVATGFYVNPAASSTATAGLSTTVPPNNLTGQSLRVTGGPGVNAVKVGQRIEAEQAAKLQRPVTLSVWVRYHDGATSATITPSVVFRTMGNRSEWANFTHVNTVALDPCAHDTWTQLVYQFDGSTIADLLNGLDLSIEFPSGALDANTKYVDVAQWMLEQGVQASTLVPAPELAAAEYGPAAIGSASNLVVKTTSTSVVLVTADELVLRAEDGRAMTVFSLSAQVDINLSGAGGLDTGTKTNGVWYTIWVIGDGRQAKAILTSSGNPSRPPGYQFKAHVGAVYLNAGGNFVSFHQRGRRVWQAKQAAFTAALSTSFAAVSLANYVPSIAKTAFGRAGASGATDTRIILSADATGGTYEETIALGLTGSFNSFTGAGFWELPMLTPQSIWVKGAAAHAHRVEVSGYTL